MPAAISTRRHSLRSARGAGDHRWYPSGAPLLCRWRSLCACSRSLAWPQRPPLLPGNPCRRLPPRTPPPSRWRSPLDRATRRLIQQGLRNQGFDPGTPDGLFGPRTRAAIREWQQSRGAPPTGYLNDAEVELLRAAAAPPPSQAVPAIDPSSTATPSASMPAEVDFHPAPAPVATEELDPQNADETKTQQQTRVATGTGAVQLPPEILLDRHLLRAERLLADGDSAAALQQMSEVFTLQDEHDFELPDGFHFQYAQLAYAAGLTETAIASLNQVPRRRRP